MTSNSRARSGGPAAPLGLAAAAALLALLAAAPAGAEPPFPALAAAPVVAGAPPIATRAAPQRARIAAARMLEPGPQADRARSILSSGPGARGGAIIVVEMAEPFRGLDRTASPAVLLDGQLLDSYVSPEEPQRVYALVPAQMQRPAEARNVQVGWLGDLERTISPPLRAPLR